MGFKQPTPIQRQAIPVGLTGADVLGCAETGSGKTVAFCAPILERLLASPQSDALILVPTRELALQIDECWAQLTRYTTNMRSAVIIGGVAFGGQTRALTEGRRLIIATPGRLLDLLDRRAARLERVAMLVLDEADRMLDMGFAPQLRRILAVLPKQRQTLLFSATWTAEVDRLSKAWTSRPTKVVVGEVSRAAPSITQQVVNVAKDGKSQKLFEMVSERDGSILVFARTKARTDRVARFLSASGVKAQRLHGGRTQGQRNAALEAFRSGKTRVLVATDIAARGLDVSHITHVINYDLPVVAEDYVHRIGRTGRAGANGAAVSLVTPEDAVNWRDITRLLSKSGSALPQLERS